MWECTILICMHQHDSCSPASSWMHIWPVVARPDLWWFRPELHWRHLRPVVCHVWNKCVGLFPRQHARSLHHAICADPSRSGTRKFVLAHGNQQGITTLHDFFLCFYKCVFSGSPKPETKTMINCLVKCSICFIVFVSFILCCSFSVVFRIRQNQEHT